MLDGKGLDDLVKGISQALPQGLRDIQQDIEKNLRAALQAGFARLDLVTREEFDVQTAVLARTRAKVETLESQVAALETHVLGTHVNMPPGGGPVL